jgi:hypothetical protein
VRSTQPNSGYKHHRWARSRGYTTHTSIESLGDRAVSGQSKPMWFESVHANAPRQSTATLAVVNSTEPLLSCDSTNNFTSYKLPRDNPCFSQPIRCSETEMRPQ